MSQTLIITGMHRSGTSLTANWLQACGLYVGARSLRDYSNPWGHFEDPDFLSFHKDLLSYNNLTHLVTDRETIEIPNEFYNQARKFVQDRSMLPQWGWKDPRASLLLDFWKEIIPDVKFLFVYRDYSQVVRSLVTRERLGSSRWRRRLDRTPLAFFNNLGIAYSKNIEIYARVWKRYNDDLLDFTSRYPDDCLLVNSADVVRISSHVLEYINSTWSFTLRPVDISEVFDTKIFHQNTNFVQTKVQTTAYPIVAETYKKLEAVGRESMSKLEDIHG